MTLPDGKKAVADKEMTKQITSRDQCRLQKDI
jgi:hypothetical protein